MKVAMLIDGWNPPIFGGGQVHVEELCKGLTNNHGCKIDLFVRKLKGDDGKIYEEDIKVGNWNIYRIGPTTKFFNVFGRIICLATTTLYLLYKTIKEKYDIIHAHAYVSGLPAKIVGFLTKTPVVYTIHGTNGLDQKNGSLFAKLEDFLICKIKYDLEISVSKRIFKYKNVNKNIKIIYNGVDFKKYDNVSQPQKHNGINFIRVGRFEWTKGLTYLLEGLNNIDKNLLIAKGFHLNLVGNGELFDEIRGKVEEYKLNDFVTFKGKLFGNDLINEYKSNHVFILPSITEGQPLTLLEAMACGLPVIVTDVGDNKYFVKNGKNGYILQPGDGKELAKIIEKVLNTKFAELEEIGERNHEFIKNYDRKNMCSNVYGEYASLKEKYR